MIITEKKYTLNDLCENMRVRVSQLSNILDTCMILMDTEVLSDNDIEGTIPLARFQALKDFCNSLKEDKKLVFGLS